MSSTSCNLHELEKSTCTHVSLYAFPSLSFSVTRCLGIAFHWCWLFLGSFLLLFLLFLIGLFAGLLALLLRMSFSRCQVAYKKLTNSTQSQCERASGTLGKASDNRSDLANIHGSTQFPFLGSVQDPGTNNFHRLRCASATSAVPSERNFFLSWYPVMKGETAEKISTSFKVARSRSPRKRTENSWTM